MACSCMIGGLTPSQKGCLTREFRLLKKKRKMSQAQKVAIALNKCKVKRK